MLRSLGLALGTGVVCFALVAGGGDWPQFRGPGGAGLADDSQLPCEWSGERNIRWKVAVPGVAWSSPVVWGDKVFLTTAVTENQARPMPFGGGGGGRPGFGRPPRERSDEDAPAPDAERPAGEEPRERPAGRGPGGRRPGGGFGGGFGRGGGEPPDALYRYEVFCLDRDSGNVLWKQLATERKPTIPTHRTNTYASETPVTDGQYVFAYFGMTGLFCFDMAGKPIWNKDLGSQPMAMGWGTGSSPVLGDDRLFLQCDNEKDSFLVALDKKTGAELWRVPRDEKSSWSTPYLWKNKMRTELVTAGGKSARAYDPANGNLLWELEGLKGRCSATPVGDDQHVYLGTGGGGGGSGPLVAVQAGASGKFSLGAGESTPAQIAWSVPRGGPPMASPLLYQGYLYILEQRGGLLSCYTAVDGKRVYQQRVPDAKGFTASPWAYGDKIFCLDEGGQTFVIQAGPDFKLLAQNPLEEMCWASPAIAGGAVILRSADHVFCIKQ